MSRFLPDVFKPSRLRHIVGLSANGAAWLTTSETGIQHWRTCSWDPFAPKFDASTAIAEVATQIDPAPKHSIAWITTSSIARTWLHNASPQANSLAELHVIAQARARALFGRPAYLQGALGEVWDVDAQWHASQAFLCVASPPTWSDALKKFFAANEASLVFSPLTLALGRLKTQLPSDGWLAIALSGEMAIACFSSGRLVRMHSIRLPDEATRASTEDAAIAEWRREMIRAEKTAEHLHWLYLMPDDGTSNASSMLKPVSWVHNQNIPSPPIPRSEKKQPCVDQAVMACWAGQQLMAGVEL